MKFTTVTLFATLALAIHADETEYACSVPGCDMSSCVNNCACLEGGCDMSACVYDCSCDEPGGCDMSACTHDCACIGDSGEYHLEVCGSDNMMRDYYFFR